MASPTTGGTEHALPLDAAGYTPRDWVLHFKTDDQGNRFQDPRQFRTRGMHNSKNMCYRNSTLQGLFHHPMVAQWLRFHHKDCNITPCMACDLGVILNVYWSNSSRQHEPFIDTLEDFQKSLQNYHGWDSPGNRRQEDAQEFCAKMVSTMMNQLEMEQFFLHDLFYLNVERRYTCPHCADQITRDATESGIQLPLPVEQKEHKLTSILKSYFNSQTVANYSCYTCGKTGEFSYKERIRTAPDALVINLKRFKVGAYGKMAKNKVPIKISPYLQLSEYTKPRAARSLRYQLVAVTKHRGGLRSGHYVTVGLTPRSNWIEANDSTLLRADINAAVAPPAPWTPYVLYYKRLHGTAEN